MNKPIFISILLAAAMTALPGNAMLNDPSAARTIVPLSQWEFVQDTSAENSAIQLPDSGADWSGLTIPHCFRLSGLPEKSAGFYRTTLQVPAEDEGKTLYLFLEGAGAIADVFVNGKHVGQHKGAYTAAWFDLTTGIKYGADNEVIVRVTNRDLEAANCLSQSNLFYTNGGLYRPVWLVKTLGVHIFPDTGSTGVYLTPKNISKSGADLEITAHIRNSLDKDFRVTVRSVITDPAGNKVGETEEKVTLPSGTTKAVTTRKHIEHPQRWNVHQGKLYTVYTEVRINGKLADAITERTGIRTIEMQDEDFVLNGEKVLVRGVCKHHQDEHVWNAMTDDMLKWEMDGMVDLGVNTVRLAHYPHRRFEYNLTDEHGILVWAENGLAGHRWDKGERAQRESEPTPVGEQINREMVRQNWNHPSIVFWSSGNETHDRTAHHYADIIREEDSTRLLTYASAGEKPDNVDFVAGNTYQGWYWGNYTDFSQLPVNEYVSETGAGCWITHHLPYGKEQWKVDVFESEEYAQMFAEFRFQTIFRNNPDGHKMFLWWNYREFYDHKFKKPRQNRNTKGILTLGGMPKDYYYHFQSFLRPDLPVLHLCGRHYFYRRIDSANGIKAYSNADAVELFINGTSCGVLQNGDYVLPGTETAAKQSDEIVSVGDMDQEKEVGETKAVDGIVVENVFFWKAELKPGKNVVEVRDNRGNSQSMVIYQKADEMPVSDESLVTNLQSSNTDSPALFIDRPIEAQGPFYTEVDGSSDNTFDALPAELEDARWIATRRLSDEKNVTDLSFKLTRPATVYVMYSTGTFPLYTLDAPDEAEMQTAAALADSLRLNGFEKTDISGTWRRHNLWLADFAVMKLKAQADTTVSIPGQMLDYVVLIKE